MWFAIKKFGREQVCLIAVVAADWLGTFSLQEKLQLFHSFFAAAPAAILLPVLVTYAACHYKMSLFSCDALFALPCWPLS